VVRGASGVQALARPALSGAFLLLAPSALALAKMVFFVVPNLGDVLQRPAPMLTAVHSDLLGGGNLSGGLPS
jgi:hypothetical protein